MTWGRSGTIFSGVCREIYFIRSGVEPFQFELTYPPDEEPIEAEEDEGDDH